MLRAKECTPTPPSAIITFGLAIESIKELGGVSSLIDGDKNGCLGIGSSGAYGMKLKPDSRSYILLEDSLLAFVYSHLIVVSKFKITPTAHSVRGCTATYELMFNVINIIQQGLEAHVLADVDKD